MPKWRGIDPGESSALCSGKSNPKLAPVQHIFFVMPLVKANITQGHHEQLKAKQVEPRTTQSRAKTYIQDICPIVMNMLHLSSQLSNSSSCSASDSGTGSCTFPSSSSAACLTTRSDEERGTEAWSERGESTGSSPCNRLRPRDKDAVLFAGVS